MAGIMSTMLGSIYVLLFLIGLTITVYALVKYLKGKTLVAVTHDDRLADLFDCQIDMNDIASSYSESEVR